MVEHHRDDPTEQHPAGGDAGPVRYPEDHVVGVLDSPEAAAAAVRTLIDGGFLESEVHLACGVEAADRLRESTGRSGLTGAVLRLADRLHLWNDELAEKHEYEEALRAGSIVLAVLAPTEERKRRAAEVFREHGGRFVNFMGRWTSERLVP
jgi:hypothetical protein